MPLRLGRDRLQKNPDISEISNGVIRTAGVVRLNPSAQDLKRKSFLTNVSIEVLSFPEHDAV